MSGSAAGHGGFWGKDEGFDAFLESVRDLLDARGSEEVLRRIASRAHDLLTRDTAAVYLVGVEPGRMRAVAAEGLYGKEFAGEVIEVGEGILGNVAASGSGEIINDVLRDPRAIQVAGTPDTQADEKLMVAPLRSNGATIGVMAVWRDVDEAPFEPEDLAILEGLGSLAVIAIENARGYEAAQERIARLSGMTEIGRVLVSTRAPDLVLETVYRQVSLLYDTTNFYVATYVEGSQEWTWALHYEGGVRQAPEVHALGAGLTGYIITHRSPVLLRDEAGVRGFLDSQGVHGLGALPQSWMGVPLVAGDEITGVMAVQDYVHPRQYSDSDLEFFSLVGTQLAVALQNARLFEEARVARAEAEASLAELRSAQSRLVTSEKMAVLGSLVSGVAHEINTPVGIALTAATYLDEQARELAACLDGDGDGDAEAVAAGAEARGEKLSHCLEGIRESATLTHKNLERAAGLISSFKQVSVDQTSEARRSFGLREYIDEVVRSLHPRLRNTGIAVEIDCPGDLVVDSYPGAFSQILTNFIINSAVHGFGPGFPAEGRRISIRAGMEEGGILRLEYADNGRGLGPEELRRLFEPFYTTMRGSGGTGLGTTVAYNLVTQRLGGSIEAESSPGKGLRYSMRLPTEGMGGGGPAPG